MVTRDELLEEAEWEARRAGGSGCLPSLKAVLGKLEWLGPFSGLLAELRREIRDLEHAKALLQGAGGR